MQATPALDRLVETIGEATPQSQELREETEARVTASAAAALTPSHGYAASFAGGRPIAAAVVRDGAHHRGG